jgi:hypothetical protein
MKADTPNNLFLKPDEKKFVAMSVVSTLEQLQEMASNPQINWNPETRKDLKDMLAAGNSLRIKLEKLGFDVRELPPYVDGDENEFLTKQS